MHYSLMGHDQNLNYTTLEEQGQQESKNTI